MLIFAFLALLDSPSNCIFPVGPFDVEQVSSRYEQTHPRSRMCDELIENRPVSEFAQTQASDAPGNQEHAEKNDDQMHLAVDEQPSALPVPLASPQPLLEEKFKPAPLSVGPIVLSPPKSKKEHFVSDFVDYLNTEVAPHTPGFAVAIMLEGEVVLLEGSGEKRRGSGDLIDTHTVFRLASVSKTFASAAVGKMVEQENVRWDDKIGDFVGGLNFSNEQYASALTLQHILSHTTGLLPHAYTNLIEEPLPFKKITSKLHNVPFVCQPGGCYGYQNVAYSLVADMFPILRRQSYEEYVDQEILRPLNMTDAHYGYRSYLNDDNRVSPHVWSRRRQAWVPVSVRANYYKVPPAAGLNASISDMAQWLRAQVGQFPQVLSADTLDAMHSKVVRTSRRQAHYRGQRWRGLQAAYYGLGWRVFDYRGHQDFVHHGGFVRGNRASVLFHRERQMGLAFLVNSETKSANDVVPAFLSRYLDAFPEKSDPMIQAQSDVSADAPQPVASSMAAGREISLNK